MQFYECAWVSRTNGTGADSLQGAAISRLQAFPLGGRCPSAHTGADEGTIQESSSLIPGMFRRPGGEFLFHVEKEPKDARGSAQDGHSVSIFAAPLEPPLRGTRTC